MWEIPCLFTIFVFLVMCVACYLRVRMVTRTIRVRFDERLAERTRAARELQDTILQTIQGSKFVADEALERSDDLDHMRLTLEKISSWLGQATHEGQAALNALSIPTTETNDQQSKPCRKSSS